MKTFSQFMEAKNQYVMSHGYKNSAAKPYVSKDVSGWHVINSKGEIHKSFSSGQSGMMQAQKHLSKHYDSLSKSHLKEGYGDEGEMDKLHPALKDLHSRLKSSEHHDRYGTDYRAEAPYGKQKHHELSTRHLGKWERADDRRHGSPDFDEDDDHEVLNKKSSEGIHKIVKDVEKQHKVKIDHGVHEKNWQSFSIKEK